MSGTGSGAPGRRLPRGLLVWLSRWGDSVTTGLVVAALALFGLRVLANRLGTVPAARTLELWAFACLVVGAFIGFLFGIPRVLQQDEVVVPPPPPPRAGAADPPPNDDGRRGRGVAGAYRQRVNTNLEQISDWLTKILVGIGLVQLGNVGEYVTGAAKRLAGAMATAPGAGGAATVPADAEALGAALVIYFLVVGFMGGYLLTRLFLAGAFSRADQRAQETVQVGDSELTLEQSAEQQRSVLADLQTQVARLLTARSAAGGDAALLATEEHAPVTTRTVVWVDDHPENNAEQVEILRNQGFRVLTAATTADGLALVRRERPAAVITDMGRRENGQDVKDAGLHLTRELRTAGFDAVFVYTSPSAVNAFRQPALDAGARLVTASPTTLLQALGAV